MIQLLAALSICAFALAPGSEQEAAAALAKAEAHIAKGNFTRAVADYRKVAKKYPRTRSGMKAARRAAPNAYIGWSDILRHGPSSNRVDVVFMGDGFELSDQKSFTKSVEDLPKVFEDEQLFGEYFSYLNFLQVHLVSAEDGIDGYGRSYSTVLEASISSDAKGEPYVRADPDRVVAMLREMPAHDDIALALVRGGGVGTADVGLATLGKTSSDILLSAWGYVFANLGNESSADLGLRSEIERDSYPNISDTDDPERVPWAHWIAAKARGVGVYRGAQGRLKGAWKSSSKGCVMGEANARNFCAVCREALLLRLYDFVDPIEAATPAGHPSLLDESLLLTGPGPHEFEVATMQPASHRLELRWWVLPSKDAPPPMGVDDSADPRPRSRRGALPPIEAEPLQERRPRKGADSFTLKKGAFDPGLYRVVCRARDTTELRGEKHPWVLKDEAGVLESERTWWVRID